VLLAGGLLGGEFLLRLAGLHTPLLYERTGYGYRVVPGQSLSRFGNAVSYDAAGLRSAPVAAGDPRPRVLCLGDSITNGGTLSDQADTFPVVLERMLGERGTGVRVMNASAGGWAPANQLGWLRENGLQGAGVVVLTLNTLDLFQPLAGSDLVGSHPAFPDRAPRFALQELFGRYLLPRLFGGADARDPGAAAPVPGEAATRAPLEAVAAIADLVRARRAVLAVMFVEQPAELEPRGAVVDQAKQRLFTLLRERGVPLARTREAMLAGGGARLLRDGLHPNAAGNLVLAAAAAGLVSSALSSQSLGGGGIDGQP
jgi:lysophospholipase L1-like esterase